MRSRLSIIIALMTLCMVSSKIEVNAQTTFTWDGGWNGEYADTSSYVIRGAKFQHEHGQQGYNRSALVSVNGKNPKPLASQTVQSYVDGAWPWNREEYRFGTSNDFGTWTTTIAYGCGSGASCVWVRFQPNVEIIERELNSSDTVVSTFTFRTLNGVFIKNLSATITPVPKGTLVARFAEGSTKFNVFESQSASVQVKLENALHTTSKTVGYSITDISATSGTDYTEPTLKSVTFNAGETMKTIEIPISMDNEFEGIEQFRITLSAGTDFTLRRKVSTVFIYDNYVPTITAPSNSCDNFTYRNGQKPPNGPNPHVEAYWSVFPSSVYQEAGKKFMVEMKFNDPSSDTDTKSNQNRWIYISARDESNA